MSFKLFSVDSAPRHDKMKTMMNEKKTNSVYDLIKGKLQSEAQPEGLRVLHVATSIAEADMLRQVLAEAGFNIEFVPATSTGVFGTTGNSVIYIAEADYAAASEFLKEYLEAPPCYETEPPPLPSEDEEEPAAPRTDTPEAEGDADYSLAMPMYLETTPPPPGMRLLHMASSNPEAEMLTQVLANAGFVTEYIPSTFTGLFGSAGNRAIYIAESEYDAAAPFLEDYLNPKPPQPTQ